MEGVNEVGVFEQAQKLSAKDKSRFVNKLLSGSGLSVVCTSHLKKQLLAQIDAMGKEPLAEVLHAIAERIAS